MASNPNFPAEQKSPSSLRLKSWSGNFPRARRKSLLCERALNCADTLYERKDDPETAERRPRDTYNVCTLGTDGL